MSMFGIEYENVGGGTIRHYIEDVNANPITLSVNGRFVSATIVRNGAAHLQVSNTDTTWYRASDFAWTELPNAKAVQNGSTVSIPCGFGAQAAKCFYDVIE